MGVFRNPPLYNKLQSSAQNTTTEEVKKFAASIESHIDHFF
jgi:hypothetical protein